MGLHTAEISDIRVVLISILHGNLHTKSMEKKNVKTWLYVFAGHLFIFSCMESQRWAVLSIAN